MKLPAEGRKGQAPAWPLPLFKHPLADLQKAIRTRETALWRDLWKKPQAVAWERFGMHSEVALYCRFRALSERGDMKAASESRQMGDRLGMTPWALLRLHWEIAADEVGAAREEHAAAKKAAAKAGKAGPRRLRAVDGG